MLCLWNSISNESYASCFRFRRYINSGDLDDVVAPGTYHISANGGGVSNFPSGAYGWNIMLVFTTTIYCVQMLVPMSSVNPLRIRMCANHASDQRAWQSWKSIKVE